MGRKPLRPADRCMGDAMGSFSTSCMLSGLPITGGDPVRFIALMENPYRDGHIVCNVNSLWVPLHIPIKARYNDYGSIEDLEEGENTQHFFETLKSFAVEREGDGLGPKVRVYPDMPIGDWLSALWCQRVLVRIPKVLLSLELERYFQKVNQQLEKLEKVTGTSLERLTLNNPAELEPPKQVSWTMIREDVWRLVLQLSPEKPGMRQESVPTTLRPLYPTDGYAPQSCLEEVIEYRRVVYAMYWLNRIWTPGHTCGPQDGDYDFQAPFLKGVAAIALEGYKRQFDGSEE